jgi:hypothetical protein
MDNLSDKLLKIKDNFIVFMQTHKAWNPVHSIDIEKEFGIAGTEVRSLTNYLRRKGYPIGNSLKQDDKIIKCYFWCENWSEMKATIIDLENRRNDLSETISALRKRFNQYDAPTLF